MSEKSDKYFRLVHPGGPQGIIRAPTMEMRAQDVEATPLEMFAVVFFPKITGIGNAHIWRTELAETMANSPEVAIAKFCDARAAVGEAREDTWRQYHEAGHRVRRVKISDMGDPETPHG